MYNIYNRDITSPFKEMEIHIFPCSLPNPSDCEPESSFENLSIWYYAPGKTIDNSKKHSPISHTPGTDVRYDFDLGGTLRMVNYFQENQIWDSNWDFINPTLKARFSSIEKRNIYTVLGGKIPRHCPAEELKKYRPNCNPYFYFSYHPGSVKVEYLRQYKTFVTTLSDIGGIYDIIILAFALCYMWYNSRSLDNFLTKKILKKDLKEFRKFFPDCSKKEIDSFME